MLPELPLRPQSCPPKVKERPGFVTTERPEKRRRTVSSSTTTLGSPLSSPCLNLSPQFSPSLDFSPLGSPQLALSPRSGSSASSGMSSCEPPSNECSFCGTVFLNLKNQKRHQCFFSSWWTFLQIKWYNSSRTCSHKELGTNYQDIGSTMQRGHSGVVQVKQMVSSFLLSFCFPSPTLTMYLFCLFVYILG